MNADFFKNLARQFSEALPEHLQLFRQDIEKHYQAMLEKTIGKLHLVKQEEFDVQVKVLARTRKKLEALEKELQELKHGLQSKPTSHE